MKKIICKSGLFLSLCLLIISCGNGSPKGFQKTDTDTYIKFEVENKENVQPKMGDVIVCELTVRVDDSVLFTNVGTPERMFLVTESQFNGDIRKDFLLCHLGDKVQFAVPADTIASQLNDEEFKKLHKPGENQWLYYEVSITSLVSSEEIDKEYQEYLTKLESLQSAEMDSIQAYVKLNKIKTVPTESGLYITYLKKGNGTKVADGNIAKINYVGRFLNGDVFDTSIEEEAQKANMHNPQRQYEPLVYDPKKPMVIDGWVEALSTMSAGDKVRLIIPSKLAYKDRGSYPVIAPFTPLVFEIEVVSVD